MPERLAAVQAAREARHSTPERQATQQAAEEAVQAVTATALRVPQARQQASEAAAEALLRTTALQEAMAGHTAVAAQEAA